MAPRPKRWAHPKEARIKALGRNFALKGSRDHAPSPIPCPAEYKKAPRPEDGGPLKG